jgi:tetratricopeptide (TPR) repeat protein
MRRLLIVLLSLSICADIAASSAMADDSTVCSKLNSDEGIAACTRLINSGRLKGRNLAVVYSNRGIAWMDKSVPDLDRAIADFDKAIAIEPSDHYFSARGSAWVKKKDRAKAVADFSSAISLNPREARYYSERGYARNKGDESDLDLAIADFTEAVRLKPDFAGAFNGRAQAWHNKRDHARAIADYSQAIRADPKSSSYYWNRGLLLFQTGELDQAIADFDQVIKTAPSTSSSYKDAYDLRGVAWFRKGDFDRAIAELGQAIRLSPTDSQPYSERGEAWLSKGDLDRALADQSEAIRLDPKSAAAFYRRGNVFRAKRDFDRAQADYEAAIGFDAFHSAIFTDRGLAYEQAGDFERAKESFNSALVVSKGYLDERWAHDTAREHLANLNNNQPASPPKVAVAASAAPILSGRSEAIATSAPVVPQMPSRRVALVIGQSDYRVANKLANPANDATDIAAALHKLGFDVVDGRNLDRRGFDDVIRAFGRKLDGADLALFFYAGHGLQVGGRNYLVPVDAKLERPGDLSLDAVDVAMVLAQMEAEKRVNLVFLDACRDNPLSRSLARSLGTRSATVGQGLASIQGAVGTMIAYATQPDNVALDGEGRNSPFTTALLRHLADPGIDISVLMKRVRADVIAATRERQIPWDHSSLIGEVVLAR